MVNDVYWKVVNAVSAWPFLNDQLDRFAYTFIEAQTHAGGHG